MSAVPDNGQTREYPQTLSHFGEASEGEGEIGPAEDPESTVEERLAAAKAHRTQAETARQKIVSEIMEAARDLHQKLVSEGEQILAKAKQLYADSELKHLEAQRKLERAQKAKTEAKAYQEKIIAPTQQEAQEILDQAQAIKAEAFALREKLLAEVQQQAQEELERAQVARVEADAYREKVLSQTQQQAQEILRQAQLAAEQQDAEIKQKYSVEVEKRLAQAELIKATAPEQIKPQGLRSNAVPLKTEPKATSKQATARLRGCLRRGGGANMEL